MNAIILILAVALAVAQAGYLARHEVEDHALLAGARTTQLQGPSASATIISNDGHSIVSHAPGGSIVATEHVGGSSIGYSAPVVAHAAPVIAHAAPVLAHAAPVVAHHSAYSTPAVAHHDIHAYSAPAVVAHHGIHTYAAPAVLAQHGIDAYAGHAYAAGSGIEGQWIADNTEKLYDDGSYKGEYHH